MRIIFMGTPDFAVESLKVLTENGKNIVAVVTSPDKPAGRGRKVQESAVKQYALSQGIPVLQPTNLKSDDFVKELRSYKADLQIVVAFRMLPELVWGMPPKGTFNLHASLLPQYRGAAPINWAIINGEEKTGATTFFLKHEIDTGDIILQEEVSIGSAESVGELHDHLMKIGGKLVLKTVGLIEGGKAITKSQNILASNKPLKEAPKIFKADCKINWKAPAIDVFNKIRGLSPYPAAWAEMTDLEGNQQSIKLFKASLCEEEVNEVEPGAIIAENKKTIKIACKDKFITIEELQLAGKKKMLTKDLLLGFKNIDSFKFI